MNDLPDSISIEIDDWHQELYHELPEDRQEAVHEFIDGELQQGVVATLEEGIYKAYQAEK